MAQKITPRFFLRLQHPNRAVNFSALLSTKIMKTVFITIFSCFLLGSTFGQPIDSSNVISGALSCSNYWPLAGQTLVLTDTLSGVALEQIVDSSGIFTFRNVPTGRTYRLSLKSALPPIDTFRAVSVLDLVKMSHHILAIRSLDPIGLLAADMNQSLGLTTFDLVQATRALLGKNPGADSIRRESVLLRNGNVYSHNIIPNFNGSIWGLQFVYYIKGDVDGSGCP